MTKASNHIARIDFRIQPEHKALIEQAAIANGQTMTQFAVSTLLKTARESIQQAALTELSNRDRDVFVEMLDSSTDPNAALRKAAKHYGAWREQA